MSDIRFNGWLHRSGTGGVWQDSSGNVGVGSSVPSNPATSANTGIINAGVVPKNKLLNLFVWIHNVRDSCSAHHDRLSILISLVQYFEPKYLEL